MSRLRAIVLGAAAGGGYPQWNCRCPVCRLAWQGDKRVRARTQASVAVSKDGENWVLLNAAPDLRAQIAATPALHPTGMACTASSQDARGSPIKAVVLTGAEVDQVAGLLDMRERQPFTIYGSAETLASIADNPIFAVLAPEVVARTTVGLERPFEAAGIEIELFAVPGKVPLYLERGEPDVTELAEESGANVGIELRAGGARLVFVPGAALINEALAARFAKADVVMLDGTLFTDDEMIRNGSGTKTGRRMGHMPVGGANGSLAALSGLPGRRIFIHINNTNPILVDGSPERLQVEAAGVEVAEDGMEIVL
ncbi:MAG: pyrroloquinoline quinone biosynthesis protein PqqB [Pseudolabrys sp.]